jgi:hypothetical protein
LRWARDIVFLDPFRAGALGIDFIGFSETADQARDRTRSLGTPEAFRTPHLSDFNTSENAYYSRLGGSSGTSRLK